MSRIAAGLLPGPRGTCFDLRMRKIAVVVPVVLGLAAPGAAEAQSYEAPKPIDVPTTPVPQGPPPAAPAKKPDAPKPTAASPATPPAKKDEPPKDGAKDEKKPVYYNNDGVFKVSGSNTNLAAPKGAPPKGTGGTGGVAKGGKVAKANAQIVAQWPGFRMTEDGGSEVMVEFSKTVAPPTRFEAAGTVTYVFKGAIVLKHNNQNPLLTAHFNTPVVSAKLVPKKGELHLVIDLRAAAAAGATSGVRAGSDPGAMQFFAKFPSGSYLPKDADDGPMLGPSSVKLKGTGKDATKTEVPAPPEKKTGGSKPGPKE